MGFLENYNKIVSDLGNIDVLAVTKYQSDEVTLEAVQQGITLIGESKVQDAKRKFELLTSTGLDFAMHMIGHLQTNKVADAVQIFELIQSVDSEKLLRKIDQTVDQIDNKDVQRVLLQLNLTGEEQKYGFSPEKLEDAVDLAKGLEYITCEGLMCMGKLGDEEMTRKIFRECKALCDQHGLEVCSMGMSQDREIAIQEGSTMVRLGSAIFGVSF